MRSMIVATLLLISGLAWAEDARWFAAGGIGFPSRKVSAEDFGVPGGFLRYEDGSAYTLKSGIHLSSGLLLTGRYTYANYGSVTLTNLTLQEDIRQTEVRAGLFYSPPQSSLIGYRVGGGYEYLDEENPGSFSSPSSYVEQGGFIEGALGIHPARWISLEVAATWFELTADNNRNVNGPEFSHIVTLHAGPVDVGLGARLLAKQRESGSEDETVEATLSVGSAWPI